MDWLYQNFIAGKQKAVVAFAVTALIAYLAKHGVVLPENATDTFNALVWGVVGLVSVYLKKNQ